MREMLVGSGQNKAEATRKFRSSVHTAQLEIAKFEKQSIDGHRGEVLCIDASDGMDYVISGGEDCTTRLWKYFEEDFQCYRLHHVQDHCRCHKCEHGGVLTHVAALVPKAVCVKCKAEYLLHPELHEKRPAVTSVAFAGRVGPAISVTRLGSLHIMDVTAKHFAKFDIFSQSIADVRVKRDAYKSDIQVDIEPKSLWLLSVVCGKQAGLFEIYAERGGLHYNYQEKAKFAHDETVMFAEHVPGDVRQGAALATCTETAIRLWSLNNEKIHEIKIGQRHFTCIKISHPCDGWSWLAASSSPSEEKGNETEVMLAFWPMKDGIVVPEEAKKQSWPLEYNDGIKEHIYDFSISPDNCFVMVEYKKASDFIQIAPSADDKKLLDGSSFVSIEGCPLKIFKEDLSNYLLSIPHKYKSNEMCMRLDCDEDDYDPRNAPANANLVAVLAFEDGTVGIWDLQGADSGQQTADMRSMSLVEIVMPVIMRVLTFGQVITFAFGPTTNFSGNVKKPIAVSSKLVQFDSGVIADYIPDVSMADLFLPEVYAAMALATLYLLCALSGIAESLARWRIYIGHSKRFDSGACCCVYRFAAYSVSVVRSCITFMLGTCSTILVVPMFKVFAKVVACEPDSDGKGSVLWANPDIVCYSQLHWKLVGACAVLLPIYFVMLLPYAVVGGDSKFVNRQTLFSPKAWRVHAERQATLIYQGAMHPRSESVYYTRVFELVIKIAMPCIVILTSSCPLVQTVAIFACGAGGYLISLTYPPLVDRVFNSAIQGGQLFTAACMFCGLMTVLVPASRNHSVSMLSMSLVMSILWSYFTVPKKDVLSDNNYTALPPASEKELKSMGV